MADQDQPRFEKFADVLARFGIREVIRALGHAPAHDHKWKSFPECPFCKNKDCAGVYKPKGSGLEKFKCHHRECSLNGVLNAVDYLALARGLSSRPEPGQKLSPAAIEFLKLAGAWKEPQRRSPVAREEPATPAEEPEEMPQIPAETGVELGETAGIWEENAEEVEGNEGDRLKPALPAAVEVKTSAPDEDEAMEAGPVEAAAEEAEPSLTVLLALREFHAAMPWLAEHEEQCRQKRGLTAETCRRAGMSWKRT